MNAGTRFVANVNRIATNVPTSDPRFDMRLTEKFEDDDAASTGWTWVAAVLIGGVIIVSGYLEQESAQIERAEARTYDQRQGTHVSVSHTVVADGKQGKPRVDKGY